MLKPDELKKLFSGKVVLKKLARDNGFPRLPQYVVEYVIANQVDLSGDVHKNIAETREYLAQRFPTPDTRQKMISHIVPGWDSIVVDRAKIKVDSKRQQMILQLENLGTEALIDRVLGWQLPRLLQDGMWGEYRLGCAQTKGDGERYGYYIEVVSVVPYQVEKPILGEYVDARNSINDQDWVDLLLSSVGYEPTLLSAREKALMIFRLIPAVEPNVNMLELGPRQTGKTYLLRNISPSVYTASGANVSAAELFVNLSTGQPGVLGTYRVVQFDEIAHTRFEDISVVSMLKDYMESGQYARGGRTYASDTSILMAGNIEVVGNVPDKRYQHLFEPLPQQLQDPAFLDRIHAYIPGWEINKLKYETISQGYGLVVDYLGQMFMELRKRDRRREIHRLDMPTDLTRRDVVAVEKLTSGLIKLIYPNDNYSLNQLAELANMALEMRWRVNNEIAKIAPGEFRTKSSRFTVPVPRLGHGPVEEQIKITDQQKEELDRFEEGVNSIERRCDGKYAAAPLEVQRSIDRWKQEDKQYLGIEQRRKDVVAEGQKKASAINMWNEKGESDTQGVILHLHALQHYDGLQLQVKLEALRLLEAQIDKQVSRYLNRGNLNVGKNSGAKQVVTRS